MPPNFCYGGLGGKSGVDVVENVIFLCWNCHQYFGSGLVWGEIPTFSSASSTSSSSPSSPYMLLHAESIALQETHGQMLNGRRVKIPTDPSKRRMFPFDNPLNEIWTWNKEWAARRRSRRENSSEME
jgi:hypothetical protein